MADQTSRSSTPVSRRQFLVTTGTAGLAAIAGCTEQEPSDGAGSNDGSGNGNGANLSGEINIAGSSTVFPLMSAIGEEFSKQHPDVSIDISSTGTGGGFSNFFCVGNTDFNNASRQIKEEEIELCEENGVEFIELVAATDALTVVVHPDAEFVDCLTVEELAQIWETDAAETWDEVREEFPNEEIARFGPADTSGTYDYFIENVQGEDRGHTDEYQATEQDNTIAQGVTGNRFAIGYFGFSYFYNNPDQLKALAIDNGNGCTEPSLETAGAGEYQPLARSLYTYPAVDSLAEPQVAEFARFFVEQTTNEDLVAGDVGYVPLTDEQQQQQMEKLESAIEEA